MYIPSTTFAAHHFKKYRHIALITPTVTGASPFLTIPPLIALILQAYGWREATFFIAAMSLQVNDFFSKYNKKIPHRSMLTRYGSITQIIGHTHSFSQGLN